MSKRDFDKLSARAEGLGLGRSKRRYSPKKTTLYTRLDLLRSLINTRMLIAVLILIAMLPPVTVQASETGTYCSCDQSCCCHPIMHPSLETLHNWFYCYNGAPHTSIDLNIEPPTGQFSLLNHLNYVPSERDQGHCGNCWVWAGTGVLEVALDVQTGISTVSPSNTSTQNIMEAQQEIGPVAEVGWQI